MGFFNKYKNADDVIAACITADPARLEKLLDVGSYIQGGASDGNTPLHCAVMAGREPRLLQRAGLCAYLLVMAGAKVDKPNDYGSTALDFARLQNQPLMVRLLQALASNQIDEAKQVLRSM